MTRTNVWPAILSVLAVVGGAPVLWAIGLRGWTLFTAVGTAVAFVAVVTHVVGTYRVGHAL